MLHTGRGVVHVQVIGQLIQRSRGLASQHVGDVGQPPVEGGHHRVDLDAVAGGQQQRLSDMLPFQQLAQHLAGVRRGHRDPLQHLDRRAAVGHPDNHQAHPITAIGSVTGLRPCDRRAW